VNLLATLLLAAIGATAPFPAAGTYTYAASLGGQPVGQWSVTVAGTADGTQINESSSASVAGMALSATAALVLGPDLAPTKYDGHYRTPGQSPNVSVSLTPATATVVGAMSSQPQQLQLAPQTRHFVVIEPGLLAGLFALPAQLAAWKDPAVTWITPTSAQAQTLSAGGSSGAARPSGVPSQDAVLSIDRPIAVTIWYDPQTLAPDQIAVPSQSAVLTRVR
jgi:hypothetical protein